jgi:hypothetical protein
MQAPEIATPVDVLAADAAQASAKRAVDACELKRKRVMRHPVGPTLKSMLKAFSEFAPVVRSPPFAGKNTHDFERRSSNAAAALYEAHRAIELALVAIEDMGMVRSEYDELHALMTGVAAVASMGAAMADDLAGDVTPLDDEEDDDDDGDEEDD